VVGAYAVLVADGAAMSHNLLAGGGLEPRPAVQGFGRVGGAAVEVGDVHAGAIAIHMRKMREDQRALAGIIQRVAQGLLNGGHGCWNLGPGQGGFQRIQRIAALPECVTQVGRGEAALVPHGANHGVHHQPTVPPGNGGGHGIGGAGQRRFARHAEDQQAALGANANQPQAVVRQLDEILLARKLERGFGFHGIREPQHRNRGA